MICALLIQIGSVLRLCGKENIKTLFVMHDKPLGNSFLLLIQCTDFQTLPSDSLLILSPLLSSPCRECEGCSGEEGEAVAEEESQTGDQRRQDGEQSLGESTTAVFKLLLH